LVKILNDLVVLKNSKYCFRYSNIVEIPRVKTTTYGKNSFKYTGIFSSFIVFAFEQKCQDKGQKLKLDNIKECKIVSLLSLDKKKTQYALVHS
jgi:hypothetical protein